MREWDLDCHDPYDERLLWLSENLCLAAIDGSPRRSSHDGALAVWSEPVVFAAS